MQRVIYQNFIDEYNYEPSLKIALLVYKSTRPRKTNSKLDDYNVYVSIEDYYLYHLNLEGFNVYSTESEEMSSKCENIDSTQAYNDSSFKKKWKKKWTL